MEVESSRGQRGRFRREGGSRLENTRERGGGKGERGEGWECIQRTGDNGVDRAQELCEQGVEPSCASVCVCVCVCV